MTKFNEQGLVKDGKSKMRAYGALVFVILWVFLMGYRFVSPEARRGREFLEHLPLSDIRYVRIYPARDNSLIRAPLVVRDRAEIKALIEPMIGMQHVVPNHPIVKWSVMITIGAHDKEYRGVIIGTSNQGVIFTYQSSGLLRWVYQQYGMRDPSGAILGVIRRQDLK